MPGFADEIDATFDAESFGELVTFTPSGGAARGGVSAIRYVDNADGAPGAGSRRRKTRWELRKAEIGAAKPANGSEILDADGVSHSVKDAEDASALGLWILTTERVGNG